MTRGGGLLAAAASRLLRRQDEPLLRLLLPQQSRALTADAAECVLGEEERRGAAAGDDEQGESASAHSRRLREMEASTSRGGAGRLETAAEVSARLLREQRSGGKAPSIRSFASPSPSASSSSSSPLRSPDGSPDEESDRANSPPLRDWRDALEAAKKLEPRGDPLTDSFGRRHTYLRISLTERCNLRCTYCMPPDGVDLTPKEHLLTTGELRRLTSLFAALGVRKVRLTGGEPTLRPDLLELARAISSQPGIDTVGLTTNGVSLGAGAGGGGGGPGGTTTTGREKVDARLSALRAAGVTSLNVSLDTLRPERFESLARRPRAGHAAALAAIESAARAGFRDVVKVNVVVMRGVNDDEVGDFSRWALSAGINVRFIEFMPFEANSWSTGKVVSYKEMLSAAREGVRDLGGGGGGGGGGAELVPLDEKGGAGFERRHYDGVAKDFVLSSSSPSTSPSITTNSSGSRPGVVSFITSMTSPFCSSCTRLRLLADGNLKVCLLGGAEASLRDAMRGGCSDADLALLVRGALANKKAAHAGMSELAKEGKGKGGVGAGRAMVRIGG